MTKHEPKELEYILEINPYLLSTLGCSEFEEIAKDFIKESIEKKEWVQKEINSHDAEEMVQVGYLTRIKFPVKNDSRELFGPHYKSPGIYKLSHSAISQIIKESHNLPPGTTERFEKTAETLVKIIEDWSIN